MPNIVISICTRERPKMLGELLQSCRSIAPVAGRKLRFIIVENGPIQMTEPVIEQFSDDIDITYVHEPRTGIVRARNKAIETFLQTDSTWLTFMDDDEIIDAGWLAAMVDAIAKLPEARAFFGHVTVRWPEGTNRLLSERKLPGQSQFGAPRSSTTTQNLMLHRELLSDDGRAMRFDLRLNTIGGSDVLLTRTLTLSGVTIHLVPNARTTEIIPDTRASLAFQAQKRIAQAHHAGLIALILYGRRKGHLINLGIVAQSAVQMVMFSVFGGIVLVFNERLGMRVLGTALQRLFLVLGRPRILWRAPPEIYATVQGH